MKTVEYYFVPNCFLFYNLVKLFVLFKKCLALVSIYSQWCYKILVYLTNLKHKVLVDMDLKQEEMQEKTMRVQESIPKLNYKLKFRTC